MCLIATLPDLGEFVVCLVRPVKCADGLCDNCRKKIYKNAKIHRSFEIKLKNHCSKPVYRNVSGTVVASITNELLLLPNLQLTSNDPTSPLSPFSPFPPFTPGCPGSPFFPGGPCFPGRP